MVKPTATILLPLITVMSLIRQIQPLQVGRSRQLSLAARAAMTRMVRIAATPDGTYVKGATLGQATAPIIGSGSYNNSAIPAAGQAVGVYRLLRGLSDTSQGVTFRWCSDRRGPLHIQPDGSNQPGPRCLWRHRRPIPGATGVQPAMPICTPVVTMFTRLTKASALTSPQLQRLCEVGRPDWRQRPTPSLRWFPLRRIRVTIATLAATRQE